MKLQDRLLISLADMMTLCTFLTISRGVHDSVTLIVSGDMTDTEPFRQFHTQVSISQREAVNWFNVCVTAVFEPISTVYVQKYREVTYS
jgi:hypothetical protein